MSAILGLAGTLANKALYVSEAQIANPDDPKPGLDTDFSFGELLKKLRDPGFRANDVPAYVDAVLHTNSLDDRKLLLEKLLTLMSRNSKAHWAAPVQQYVINLLYTDLPHPPASYLSMESATPPEPVPTAPSTRPYAYRTADGSKYNPLQPNFGRAGMPYARSVAGTNFTPLKSLPDAGLLFDTLLRRPDTDEDKDNLHFQPHPGGISSLFFAFANLIIHSVFHTDPRNPTINLTSSYLDLGPLYGNNETELNSVRRKDGTGRLWEDVFADSRILLMPPSTNALLIIFSRNHNFIAQKLLEINERGTYVTDIKKEDDAAKFETQEEDIFQRARLINCAQFVQTILGDYVGTILGLQRDGYSWRLNPLKELRHLDHTLSPRGEGNVCSIEFNLLYRWHATLSSQDSSWLEDEFRSILGKDVEFDTIDKQTFIRGVAGKFSQLGDVKTWTFEGLKRDVNGRFPDAAIAKILQDATDWRAGAFKAKGIPAVMRVIETMAIESSRKWGSCSMNEFRKFMGLKPFASFKEWNSDPAVYNVARQLYKDIDNLELYVGLQAEEAKKPGEGAALCPGYTISRAILADAVCLTRGDKFLTAEFTPHNYTSWGYHDCQFDPEDGSYGSMLPKILFRLLPSYYPKKSAYTYFPFIEPKWFKEELEKKKQGDVLNDYEWARPQWADKKQNKVVVVGSTDENAEMVLNVRALPGGRQGNFTSSYIKRLNEITNGLLGEDESSADLVRALMRRNKAKWADWVEQRTLELIQDRSINHISKKRVVWLDVVRAVSGVVGVQLVSEVLTGLPLMEKNVKGSISEAEMVDKFAEIARYVYVNFDGENDFHLRKGSKESFKQFTEFIKPHLDKMDHGSLIDDLNHVVSHSDHESHDFLGQVVKEYRTKSSNPNQNVVNLSTQDIAIRVFAETVPTVALFSKALALVLDYYLDEGKEAQRTQLVEAAREKSSNGDAEVKNLVREALKQRPLTRRIQRNSKNAVRIGSVEVNQRDDVVVGATEGVSGELELFDFGQHGLLNSPLFTALAPRVLGPILALPGIRRAAGDSGHFTSFVQQTAYGNEVMYLTSEGIITPFPESLVIQFTAPF